MLKLFSSFLNNRQSFGWQLLSQGGYNNQINLIGVINKQSMQKR